MNTENTTKCGYAGSDMVKAKKTDDTGLGEEDSTLHKIYNDYIKQLISFKKWKKEYETGKE